jgi:hypothetical protein
LGVVTDVVIDAAFSVVCVFQWEMDRKCKVGKWNEISHRKTAKPHTHTHRQTDRQYAVNKFDREKRKTCWLLSPLKTDESGEESTGSLRLVDDAIPHSSELEFHSISSLSSTEYKADNFPRFSLKQHSS